MEKVKLVFEEKRGSEYVPTWETDDVNRVYEGLTHELISKKICGCTYIKSITRKQLYNGFIRVTVAYGNGRRVYTINEH